MYRIMEAVTGTESAYSTLTQTSTGTWSITYNGENRPVRFENAATQTIIDCAYDSQGRRFEKKVTVAGATTLHHRYIYRGYLQIAALDLTRLVHPALWFVTWDPSQPTATRPLAIQKDGTWFTYGYDLTKNICEVFGPAGYIRTSYSYAPFGNVTESGDVSQPFQWSSEHYDSELDLVYYNYRHYSPSLGRFLSRDPIEEQGGLNLYAFVENRGLSCIDFHGTYTLSLHEERRRPPVGGSSSLRGETSFGIANYRYEYRRLENGCFIAWFFPPIEIVVNMWYYDDVARAHEYQHLSLITTSIAPVEYEISGIYFKKASCIGMYIKKYMELTYYKTFLPNLEFDLQEYSIEYRGEVQTRINAIRSKIKKLDTELSRIRAKCVKE